MNVYLRILQILFCCVFHFTFIWAAAASDGCCCNLEWSWLWRHAVSLLNSCGKSPQFFLSYTVLVVTPPLHFLYFKLILSFCYSCTTTIYQSDWFFHCGDFFLLYGYMIIKSFKKYTSVNVYCVLLEMDHQCKSRKIYEQIISHSEIFTFTTEYDFNMSNATDRY